MILQRYILRELVQHFVFAFTAVMGVSLLGTTFQVFRTFEGLGLVLLLKIAPLAVGYVAPWALLVASATAATLVYGRMSAENEITAMKASGIGVVRILAPAFLFSLGLCVAGYGLAEHVTPWARHTKRTSAREAMFEVLKAPPPGIQRFNISAYKLSYLDFKDGRLEKPSLLRFADEKLLMEYHAPSGQIHVAGRAVKIVMSRPRYTQYDPKTGAQHRFEAQSDVEIPLELDDFIPEERRIEDKPSDELWRLYYFSTDRKRRALILLILHSRYAQAAAPLLLVLVGAPIGIWVRKGSRLAGLGAALPPLLFYFIAFFVAQGMGEKGKIAPLPAAWIPDAGLALVAAVLLWRSRR
jgi:lipopolysaccharide export LptBFGC system permease protein LptF